LAHGVIGTAGGLHANGDDFVVMVNASAHQDRPVTRKLVPAHVDLGSIDSDAFRGSDSDADAVALYRDHSNPDVAVDDDFFARPT